MPQDAFNTRRLLLSGAIIAVLLIAAQAWVRSSAPAPAEDVPQQGRGPGGPLRLEATWSEDLLIGTVSAFEKNGRPWRGTSGEARLLDASGGQVGTVPLEPIGPGEFRLIAPLSQIGSSGYVDIRLSGQESSGERRAVYQVDGDEQAITYQAEAMPDAVSPVSAQASGGPDAFGYTWDDTAEYNWVETAGGTEITLRDDEWSGPFEIGFKFSFYGREYDVFYVDSNGYIGFDEDQSMSYYANTRLPNASRPSGLIAPFWDDFDPSEVGTVRYRRFLEAPNPHVVVEWNAVPFYGLSDLQTFQVILYEGSNDIKFQYRDTREGDYGDGRSATMGIENLDGTIGLEYPYLIPITQTLAIEIDYSQAQYNAFLTPEGQGSSAAPEEAASFRLTVKNLGYESDAFTLSWSTYDGSSWPVSFYEADGSTPLSGGSTGAISPAGEKEIVAKVEVPGSASTGDWTRAVVQATSEGNSSEYHLVTIDTVVGTSFAQVYTDDDSDDGTEDSENYYASLQEGQPHTKRVTTDQDDSSYAAVATTPGGDAVNIWNTTYYNGEAFVSEIQYAVLNRSGGFVQPVVRLTDNSEATQRTFDFSPAVDVAPNGNIAVGWARQPGTYNIWYAVQSSSGDPIKPPTRLTNNTGDYPRDYPPSVAAMTGGRFLLAWEHAAYDGGPIDVYYAVLNNDGSVHIPASCLTDQSGVNATPRVAALPNGEAAIIWTFFNDDGYPELVYVTMDSNGSATRQPTQITSNDASGSMSYDADVVALSDGRVAAAWTQAAGYNRQIQYTILSGSAPSQGIHGQVTYQGAPVEGINLALGFDGGSGWSTMDTTATDADGTYSFTGADSLSSGERYRVSYQNSGAGDQPDRYLAFWNSFAIESYTAGQSVAGGDFDIANIPLVSPDGGETVTLPQAFEWQRRSATTSDSYQFHLFDPTELDPWVYAGDLGYVNSFTVDSLPEGFSTGTQYGWMVWVDGPDGGYGASYYYRTVTFSSGTATLEDGADEERPVAELGLTDMEAAKKSEAQPLRRGAPLPQVGEATPEDAGERGRPLAELGFSYLDEADRSGALSTDADALVEPVGEASVSQDIHTVPNDLSIANVNVSLTTDDDDNLIMTWLDDWRKRYLFYALADSSGNIQTPATIFQRTRRSYLWSSWNGYGNDVLSPTGKAMAVYLPLAVRNYAGEGPGPTEDPVLNGGFEAGNLSDWNPDGDEPGLEPGVVTSPRHGGSYAAVLGEENAPCKGGSVGRSWIYQDIPVPSTSSPQLSLYHRILTYDKLQADKFDRFEIYINGTLLGRFGDTEDFGCDPDVSDLGWQPFTYDLSPYRGQTVRLRLVNVTHPDDWFATWTYVDDVTVTP